MAIKSKLEPSKNLRNKYLTYKFQKAKFINFEQ